MNYQDTNRINKGIFDSVAIDGDILDAFIEMGKVQTFSNLDKICGMGERSYFIGFIVEGNASVLDAEGMTLAQVEQGDVFGEISLILDSAHTANVVGVGDGYFLRIEFDDLNRFFSTKPKLRSIWSEWLSKKVAERLSMFVHDKREYVALIADDNKQEILIDFALGHYDLLSNVHLIGTGIIGKELLSKGKLSLSRSIPSELIDGDQSVASLITTGNIKAVIFLKDPLYKQVKDADTEILSKLCDFHNVPFVTDIASAELLLKGMVTHESTSDYIMNHSRELSR